MDHHTTTINIHYGEGTQGFFSYESPDSLVVFVHGFGGNSLTTWNNFPSILLDDENFKKADILYYGYDTFNGQAGDHAGQLYRFLKLAVLPLKNEILPANQQLPERNYGRIVLVAHSLGAILVRQALILASIAKDPWIEKTRMALFAPAHHGASVLSLLMDALGGITSLFGLGAKYRFPILSDLDRKSSVIIKEIYDATKQLQDQGKGDFTKASLVFFAKNDKVVTNTQYLNDTPSEVIEGSSHTKVCKPAGKDAEYMELIKKLVQ